MRGIPPVQESDSEDVAWALQTADALWQRGERVDALVWLRRAAQAAGDADDNDRALGLARGAAELSEWMTQSAATGPASEPPPGDRINDSIEELLAVSRGPDVRSPAPSAAETHAGMLHPWTDEETRQIRQPVSEPSPEPRIDRPLVDDQEELTETVTAIAARTGRSALSSPPSPMPPPPPELFDDDVITSAKGHVIRVPPVNVPPVMVPPSNRGAPPAAPAAPPRAASPAAPRPPAQKPLPPRPPPPAKKLPVATPPPPTPPPPEAPGRASETEFLSDADLVTVPPAALTDSQTIHLPPREGGPQDSVTTRVAHIEPPETSADSVVSLDESAVDDSVETSLDVRVGLGRVSLASASPAASDDAPTGLFATLSSDDEATQDIGLAVHESGTLTTTSSVHIAPADSSEDLSSLAADPSVLDAMPAAPLRTTDRPVAVQAVGGREIVDLSLVDALSDIPDDEREAFAATASFHDLTTDEDVHGFALALVISGEVDVVATVLDAAEHIAPGTVLRARGTNEKGFELRLVCRSATARVATWPAAPVAAAFASCPWVEDDLRIATDCLQALVGITSGPLADRLDESLRHDVVQRMSTRALGPHEVLMKKGEPVPGAYLVGVGGLETVEGDAVTGEVVVGDFVFPTAVLGAGAAPVTVRAPEDGAVVLFADRKATQELLVTCPPLLEILAGM